MDADAGGTAFSPASDPASRRRHRTMRVAAANRIFRHAGLRLADWRGGCYLLSNGRGRTIIVQDMGQLCTAVERMLGAPLDPLDSVLLDRIEKSQ